MLTDFDQASMIRINETISKNEIKPDIVLWLGSNGLKVDNWSAEVLQAVPVAQQVIAKSKGIKTYLPNISIYPTFGEKEMSPSW